MTPIDPHDELVVAQPNAATQLAVARMSSSTSWRIGIATLIGTFITVGGVIGSAYVTSRNSDSNTEVIAAKVNNIKRELLIGNLINVKAVDYLGISDATREDQLDAEGLSVSGTLPQHTLPNGAQIWAGSGIFTSDTPPATPTSSFGLDVGNPGPCNVDFENSTFDCGRIAVGNKGEKGSFAIYVGLVTSDQAHAMTRLLTDQICASWTHLPDDASKTICVQDWTGSPPAGIKWLPPLVKKR